MIKGRPKHIGIIPDGNRRWAKSHGMAKKDGYEYGLQPGLKLLRIARENGIEEVTYYGFTVDNCKRPAEQFQAFKKACVDAVEMLCSEGADLLVNYGWQWDISHIKKDGQPYSSDISRIDMIIRWGGMRRLSGFLPIQSVYSDFYVVDNYWPDYKDEDFMDALAWYEKQDVTLGG